MFRIAPESTYYLGARTLQITQFINLPGLNNPTLIRLAIVPFRIDPVEIPIILDIDLLMYREDMILNAFYSLFPITHVLYFKGQNYGDKNRCRSGHRWR